MKRHLTKDNERELEKRYLKGVQITDLAVQFNCSKHIVKRILSNRGLVIVSNRLPYSRRRHLTNKRLSKDRGLLVAPATSKSAVTDICLFELLRELRLKQAKIKGLPPFVLFLNASLLDMATKYPTSLQELEKCWGVGQGKAAKFGKPFIELIADYIKQNNIIPRSL